MRAFSMAGALLHFTRVTPRFVSRPPTFAPVAPPPGAKIPVPPTATAICGATIVCTLTPTSNNSARHRLEFRIDQFTDFIHDFLLGESPHTPREQPVESAGIPDLLAD